MIQFPITNKLAVKPTNSICKPPMALITLTSLRKLAQYVGTWFPSFQGQPLISGAMPLESGAGFA